MNLSDGSFGRLPPAERGGTSDSPTSGGRVQDAPAEWRRVEIARRESEERFRTVMENSPIGMALVGPTGKFLAVNRAVSRILGYSREELLGLDFQTITHAEDIGADLEHVGRVLRGDIETYQMEKRYFHKNGQVVWALLSVSLVREDEGRTAYFISQIQDITAQKQNADEKRMAAERMQLAIQVGQIGIWEVDLTTGRIIWDAAMYSIYGMPPELGEEAIRLAHQAIHPEDADKVAAAFRMVLEGKSNPEGIEYRIFHGRGEGIRTLRAKNSAICNADGRAERIIGICRDVTEERRREHELSRALAQEKELTRKAQAGEHAKGEFLAVMSHEIRTPMNGILGFAELLNRASELSEESRDHAQAIVESGGMLLRILDDILDFSSLEAGRIKIVRERFSPQRLVKELGSLLTPSAREAGLHFQIEIDSGMDAHFMGDQARLRQILLNLGINAVKFTVDGTIVLGARSGGICPKSQRELVEFFMRDTGPGISEERREYIFEPFVQGDSGRSRRYGGTGLGLTISRRFAELMGGTLTLQSEMGIGSEFALRLPLERLHSEELRPEGARMSDAADPLLASRYPLRILVVEDDRINLKLILAIIRKFGYTPLSARSGREAVTVYEQESPDCVLMDLQMPEMDGVEATMEIRKMERSSLREHAFIAALTANTVPADRDRCFEAGMDEYLNKPVNRHKLVDLLVRASESSRATGG